MKACVYLAIAIMLVSACSREEGSGGGSTGRYDVVVFEYDEESKLQAIKAVRELTDLGLKDAKDFVENLHRTIQTDLSEEEAREVLGKLAEAGMKAKIEEHVEMEAHGRKRDETQPEMSQPETRDDARPLASERPELRFKPFKEGDIVALKTGGPMMVVHKISDSGDSVLCTWTTDGRRPLREWFEPAQLRKIGEVDNYTGTEESEPRRVVR